MSDKDATAPRLFITVHIPLDVVVSKDPMVALYVSEHAEAMDRAQVSLDAAVHYANLAVQTHRCNS